MNIRRLGAGDERVVTQLATQAPPADAPALLADDRTIFLVAFDDDRPIGFVLAYDLLRRHGDPSKLFVYEVGVAAAYRRRGVGTALLRELASIARARGIRRGWVLTDRTNDAATALYRSAGGVRPHEETMWEFEYTER